jgi:uncharacterized damage-inducible protein DinB
MITTIEMFKTGWQGQSNATRKILAQLTDESLQQAVAPGHRTLGGIAWHIVTTLPEMAEQVGLQLEGPRPDAQMPGSASEILAAYEQLSGALFAEVTAKWTDQTLEIEDDLYGERWKRSLTLSILMLHEVHHRGQMTVLMRQAGLRVPGVFGPAKEEWAQYGADAPAV